MIGIHLVEKDRLSNDLASACDNIAANIRGESIVWRAFRARLLICLSHDSLLRNANGEIARS
jgi:hypothetical protein